MTGKTRKPTKGSFVIVKNIPFLKELYKDKSEFSQDELEGVADRLLRNRDFREFVEENLCD